MQASLWKFELSVLAHVYVGGETSDARIAAKIGCSPKRVARALRYRDHLFHVRRRGPRTVTLRDALLYTFQQSTDAAMLRAHWARTRRERLFLLLDCALPLVIASMRVLADSGELHSNPPPAGSFSDPAYDAAVRLRDLLRAFDQLSALTGGAELHVGDDEPAPQSEH